MRGDQIPVDFVPEQRVDMLIADGFTRESGVCEEFGYQAARRKACILLVSCRSVTNFVKMELLGAFKRNSGEALA